MDQSQSVIAGERREVTVLLFAVRDLLALSSPADADALDPVVDEVIRLAVDAITRYEGTIDTFTPDGLRAMFGMPNAHENDVERGIYAALAITKGLEPVRARVTAYGLAFAPQVAIHTGQIVASNITPDLDITYGAVGNTLDLAQALLEMAQPGQILLSAASQARVREVFQFQPVAPLGANSADCYLLLSAGSTEPAHMVGATMQVGSLIGRDISLSRINAARAALRDDHSRVVLLSGVAGIGKSHLLRAFAENDDDHDVRYLRASAGGQARAQSLGLLADMLRTLLGLSSDDTADAHRAALDAFLSYRGLPGEHRAYLLHLLGHPDADPDSIRQLRFLDPAVLQRQTDAALHRVIVAEAQSAPLVLLCENLQWLDQSSQTFLLHLIETTDNLPLLFVLVTREAARAALLEALRPIMERRPERLIDIPLPELGEDEALQLVDQVLEVRGAPLQISQPVVRRARGNPLYIIELIRMLIDQGGLQRTADGWGTTASTTALLRNVPGTIKGLSQVRFETLPETARRILQRAAVLGPRFPLALLERLHTDPPEQLYDELAMLESRRFLTRETQPALPQIVFSHPLMQEVVYGTLLPRDRTLLHDQAAAAIEVMTSWPPEVMTELLAVHYGEGTQPQRALPFLVAAGDEAARRANTETASAHYRRALGLLGADPAADLAVRARLGLGRVLKLGGDFAEAGQMIADAAAHTEDRALLVDILREMADVRIREGQFDAAVVHLERGIELVQAETASTDDVAVQRRTLFERLAWVRFRQGRLDEAATLAESVAGVDPLLVPDPLTVGALLNTLGGIAWQTGRLPDAAAYVERSLQISRQIGYAWGMATAYTNLGVLEYGQGQWELAAEHLEQAEMLRRTHGYLADLALTLKNLGMLRVAMGDLSRARDNFAAGLAVSEQLGERYGVVVARLGLAQVAVLEHRIDAAADQIAGADALMDAAGEDEAIEAQRLSAVVELARGDARTALATATAASQQAEAADLPELIVDCRRVAGQAALHVQDWRVAETEFETALQISRTLDDRLREGQILYELGRLYRTRLPHPNGWHTQSDAAFRAALACFDQLGAAYDRALAVAELASLDAVTSPAELQSSPISPK